MSFNIGKQKHEESIAEYIRRFKNTKNRWYSLVISEKNPAELALNGLRSQIKEKLEGYEFLTINQVLQRALAQESRSKECKLNPIVLLRMYYMAILHMMKLVRSMLLNLYGHLAMNQAPVHL